MVATSSTPVSTSSSPACSSMIYYRLLSHTIRRRFRARTLTLGDWSHMCWKSGARCSAPVPVPTLVVRQVPDEIHASSPSLWTSLTGLGDFGPRPGVQMKTKTPEKKLCCHPSSSPWSCRNRRRSPPPVANSAPV
jgi:hypothetical protein